MKRPKLKKNIFYQVQSFPDSAEFAFYDDRVYFSKKIANQRRQELQQIDDSDDGIHEYIINTLKLIT